FLAGDFNAESDSPAVRLIIDAGFEDTLPGGIDHIFVPREGAAGWKLESVRWTFRPEDMPHLIGKEAEISDHPGMVADFVRKQDVRMIAGRGATFPARPARVASIPGRLLDRLAPRRPELPGSAAHPLAKRTSPQVASPQSAPQAADTCGRG